MSGIGLRSGDRIGLFSWPQIFQMNADIRCASELGFLYHGGHEDRCNGEMPIILADGFRWESSIYAEVIWMEDTVLMGSRRVLRTIICGGAVPRFDHAFGVKVRAEPR